MGSGDSTTSGRGQPWHHVPRALHTNGQRITTRIPSWLHLTALGQHLHAHLFRFSLVWPNVHGTPQWLPALIHIPTKAEALPHEGASALVCASLAFFDIR